MNSLRLLFIFPVLIASLSYAVVSTIHVPQGPANNPSGINAANSGEYGAGCSGHLQGKVEKSPLPSLRVFERYRLFTAATGIGQQAVLNDVG